MKMLKKKHEGKKKDRGGDLVHARHLGMSRACEACNGG